VLSLPKRLRPYLALDPVLVGRILAVLLRIIRGALREAGPDAPPDAALGAVSFLHRFGSSLNPHLHLHLVVVVATSPVAGGRPGRCSREWITRAPSRAIAGPGPTPEPGPDRPRQTVTSSWAKSPAMS
jgi:hypothetical protein